jgi:hypothetical protein
VHARKCIVVSAGSLHTPCLLKRYMLAWCSRSLPHWCMLCTTQHATCNMAVGWMHGGMKARRRGAGLRCGTSTSASTFGCIRSRQSSANSTTGPLRHVSGPLQHAVVRCDMSVVCYNMSAARSALRCSAAQYPTRSDGTLAAPPRLRPVACGATDRSGSGGRLPRNEPPGPTGWLSRRTLQGCAPGGTGALTVHRAHLAVACCTLSAARYALRGALESRGALHAAHCMLRCRSIDVFRGAPMTTKLDVAAMGPANDGSPPLPPPNPPRSARLTRPLFGGYRPVWDAGS